MAYVYPLNLEVFVRLNGANINTTGLTQLKFESHELKTNKDEKGLPTGAG